MALSHQDNHKKLIGGTLNIISQNQVIIIAIITVITSYYHYNLKS